MSTVFDYLDWRGDVPFDTDPFNEVDNLILAELAYTRFGGIVPEDGAEVSLSDAYDAYFAEHPREEIGDSGSPTSRAPLLMDGMLSGKRFAEVKLSRYASVIDEDRDAQFSAVTYRLPDGTAYVAFRGTDSTIVGWKEDLNMSFLPVTEGQKKAAEYLSMAGGELDMPIRVGGHSKGGNFAVFASAFCSEEAREKLIAVYTNDGPGFRPEIMESEEYARIVPLVVSIVPDTSIIGMLLTSKSSHRIVKSSASGIMQHDGMTWQVSRNRFITAELSDLAAYIRKTQTDWLGRIDDEARESFVNTLFSVFEATGAWTFTDMGDQKLRSLERMISAVQKLPRDKQIELGRIAGELMDSGRQTLADAAEEMIRTKLREWDDNLDALLT